MDTLKMIQTIVKKMSLSEAEVSAKPLNVV